MSVSTADQRRVIRPGIVIGIGIGAFFDGIVFHQILQWHHLLTSAGYPPDSVQNLQINTLADGLFHAAAWIFTLAGLFMLWQVMIQQRLSALPAERRSPRILIGALLMGWGGFNLVEGRVDHHLLQIHHVHPGPNEAFWDIAFLVWGALMLIGGYWLTRRNPAA